MQFEKVLVLIFVFWGTLVHSQQSKLSALAKVSILTIGPGNELDSKFGHSALRVQDPTIGMDIVYNYGMFDFKDPNFYLKFARGKLDYWIAKESYERFLYGYQLEKRWVKEQILNLSASDVQKLYQFLEHNYLPENRFYKYDFFFDNCTTRLPDALETVLGDNLQLVMIDVGDETTYRDLIHQNLELNSWSNFGIDLALGSVIDKKGTAFLPINVLEQFKISKINNQPLVFRELDLLPEGRTQETGNFLLSPVFWLSILALVVLGVTYKDYKKQRRSTWIDFLLFFTSGAAGVLILFLWFATDHQATKMNYNALWAFAPNIVVAFIALRRPLANWLKTYLFVLQGLLALTLLLWIFKIQVFSPLILLIVVTMVVRYFFLIKFPKSINLSSRASHP